MSLSVATSSCARPADPADVVRPPLICLTLTPVCQHQRAGELGGATHCCSVYPGVRQQGVVSLHWAQRCWLRQVGRTGATSATVLIMCSPLPQVDLPGLRQRQLLLRHHAAVRRLAGAQPPPCVGTCTCVLGCPTLAARPACRCGVYCFALSWRSPRAELVAGCHQDESICSCLQAFLAVAVLAATLRHDRMLAGKSLQRW